MLFRSGFPKTEAEATAHAAFVGCSEDFACRVWNEAAGRGGLDCFGKPVIRWRNYLKARSSGDQSREAERKSRNTFTSKKIIEPDYSKAGF